MTKAERTQTRSQARALLPREADLAALFGAVHDLHCISVVGVSNLGKSALLRSLTDTGTRERYLGREAADYVPIYIDFNRMLDMTEQAFYELILRCTLDALVSGKTDSNVGVRAGSPASRRAATRADSLRRPGAAEQQLRCAAQFCPGDGRSG